MQMENNLSIWNKANVIATVTSSITSVAMLVIAIWGLFFTSLPEEVIASLNSEVALTKSELLQLGEQKRELELEVEIKQASFEKLMRESDTLTQSLAETQTMLSVQSVELKQIEKNKARLEFLYLERSKELLKQIVLESIGKYKYNVSALASYSETLNFIEKQPDRNTKGFNLWFAKIHENYITSFEDLSFADLEARSIDGTLDKDFKWIIAHPLVDDLIEDYDLGQKAVTGKTLIFNSLDEFKLIEQDPEVFKAISSNMRALSQEQANLGNRINPILLSTMSANDITSDGIRALKALEAAELLVENL